MNSTVIIVIGSIIVAFIFITWLVRYISGLKKTRDFYQKKISEMKGTKVDQVYIGSCTNGRISDLRIAAKVLKGHKLADGVRGIVSPATPKIYKMAVDEGIIDIFLEAGFCVTNPTCGARLGMSNGVLAEGEVCASTTNRNFNGRMGKGGMVHLMSPASAAATAITGTIANSELYKG